MRKAAGSASPLPKDDGGSANDGSADRAGGEAWVCSPGSCAPGSAPGGVCVAGCTPPCVYGSDAAASTGVLPRPEIPSIALSEVERESSSLCSLVVRASPPQPSSVWEASCAASDATRRGVSASPLPPSETAAAHASGPSSEAGATSSPALGAASPKAACAVNGEGASVGAGMGTAAGAAATALPPRPGGSESRAPRPSATALGARGRGGPRARRCSGRHRHRRRCRVARRHRRRRSRRCRPSSRPRPSPQYRPTTWRRRRSGPPLCSRARWGGRPSAAAASPCPGRPRTRACHRALWRTEAHASGVPPARRRTKKRVDLYAN